MQKYKNLKKDIDKDGFVILRDAYSPQKLILVKNLLIDYIKNSNLNNPVRDCHFLSDGSISSVHNIIDFLPSYQDITSNETAIKFAKCCFSLLSDKHFNSSSVTIYVHTFCSHTQIHNHMYSGPNPNAISIQCVQSHTIICICVFIYIHMIIDITNCVHTFKYINICFLR